MCSWNPTVPVQSIYTKYGFQWLICQPRTGKEEHSLVINLQSLQDTFSSAWCNAVRSIVGQTTDKPQVLAQGDPSPSQWRWTIIISQAQISETAVPLVKHRLSVTANPSWWCPLKLHNYVAELISGLLHFCISWNNMKTFIDCSCDQHLR